jgi:hypothetical protein
MIVLNLTRLPYGPFDGDPEPTDLGDLSRYHNPRTGTAGANPLGVGTYGVSRG